MNNVHNEGSLHSRTVVSHARDEDPCVKEAVEPWLTWHLVRS